MIDFDAPDLGSSAVMALSNTVRLQLIKLERYTVVDRNNMQQILEEQGFQQSGACSDLSCLVQIGRLLGVQKMIGGTIGMLGRKYIIDLQIVDVETGKIDKLEREEYTGGLENLDVAIINVTRRLVGEPVEPRIQTILRVNSNPAGADVYVEENFLGKTPVSMQVEDVKPHRVRLYKQGFLGWEKTVTIRDYEVNEVNVDLVSPEQIQPPAPEKKTTRANFTLGAMYGMGNNFDGQTGEGGHFTFAWAFIYPWFSFYMSYSTDQKYAGTLDRDITVSYFGFDWNYYFVSRKHYKSGLGIGFGKFMGTDETVDIDFFSGDRTTRDPEDIELASFYLNLLAEIPLSPNFALSVIYRAHFNAEDFEDNWGTFDGGILIMF